MKHFTIEEFMCPCCGVARMNEAFIERLDKARGLAGVPFKLSSAYRCDKHNGAVGGVPGSAHMYGLAVDIVCSGSAQRFAIVNALLASGFKRIGIADTFVHVDNDGTKPQNRIWTY